MSGFVIGALITVGSSLAQGVASNVSARKSAEAQNRVNQAYNQFNRESRDINSELSARSLSQAKDFFSRQQARTKQKMAMTEDQMRDKAQRQDAAIKNSILMAHRSTPASNVARADRNILRLEMDNNG